MNINKVPNYCKKCVYLWTGGVKTGGYSAWCCNAGKPAQKNIGHCKNHNLRKLKETK